MLALRDELRVLMTDWDARLTRTPKERARICLRPWEISPLLSEADAHADDDGERGLCLCLSFSQRRMMSSFTGWSPIDLYCGVLNPKPAGEHASGISKK